MGPTQIAKSAHDRFMQIVQNELDAFERREKEFLMKEREERAAEMLLTKIDTASKQTH